MGDKCNFIYISVYWFFGMQCDILFAHFHVEIFSDSYFDFFLKIA